MSKRWLLTVPILAALALAAWFEPTRSVRGWLRGEPFFQGRSASYWEAALADGDPDMTAQTPDTLEAGKAQALPVLLRLLDSPLATVRIHAADIIGRIGAPAAEATPALLARLDDADPYVRTVSAESLAKIKPNRPEVIKALTEHLKGPDRDRMIRPLSAFGAAARDAVPALTEIAADAKVPTTPRWEAIRALGKIGPDARAATPVLIAALKDPDALVREHAAESLGELGATEAISHLVQALGDPEPRVRRDAARSLGQFGPSAKSALPSLEKLARDREEIVRDAARTALRRIDPSRTGGEPGQTKSEEPD